MTRTCGYAALGVLVVAATTAAQSPTIKPVASVGQLHDAMINPSSDAIFDVGRSAPETDAAWTAVRNAAVILAESSNLLMLEGRAPDDTGPWMEMSRDMLDAAVMALSAAEAEDLDGVMEAGGRIVEVCEACHEPYRDGGRKMGPPPDAAPVR